MIVDIDVEATRNYYKQAKPIDDCTCSGCRNYRQYMKQCSDKIKDFFSKIGIDNVNYITEIITYGDTGNIPEKHPFMEYGGFYHVKGEIIKNKKSKHDQEWIKIDDNFSIIVHDEIDYLPDEFPEPRLQIEIDARIPWLLDE